MTSYDPSTAPRRREDGYKGDGWTVTLPAEASGLELLLDTGLDSICIVRIGDDAWDRGGAGADGPLEVHAHEGYDEAVVLRTGAGTLHHGPDPSTIASDRFEAPVVLVLPAGTWHRVEPDRGVPTVGLGYFTRAGTTIEPFSRQLELLTRGDVTFADRPIARPPVVTPGRSTASARRGADGDGAGATPRPARIVPFPAPEPQGYTLPVDTGSDSLFVMTSPPPAAAPVDGPPETVEVHRHPDVDEYIVRDTGSGFLLNGPSLQGVTRTPFDGPTLIVMPAGAFHRIVMLSERASDSVLVYADRRAVVERYDAIMARTTIRAVARAGVRA